MGNLHEPKWGRMASCGRLSIGLTCGAAKTPRRRVPIGRRMPSCPTLAQPHSSTSGGQSLDATGRGPAPYRQVLVVAYCLGFYAVGALGHRSSTDRARAAQERPSHGLLVGHGAGGGSGRAPQLLLARALDLGGSPAPCFHGSRGPARAISPNQWSRFDT